MPNSVITGIGRYIPEKIYNNAYFESIINTDDECITRLTGIKERHIADKGEYTTDLATKAGVEAIKNAGLMPEDIDLIMVATVTPDYFTPCCACVVQNNLGAVNSAAFDFNSACSGFVTGMVMADQFIKNGVYKNILIICADVLSKVTDYKDRVTCVLFGDAAGAVVISADDTRPGILSYEIGADGSGNKYITSLAVKDDKEEVEKRPGGQKETIWMTGQPVMKFAVDIMSESTERVLKKAGLTYDDIKLIVPHQANYRIVDSALKKMGVEKEKVLLTMEKYGNTSASCIPCALYEAVECGKIKRGDKVVIVGFGGGLTWGAAVFEY